MSKLLMSKEEVFLSDHLQIAPISSPVLLDSCRSILGIRNGLKKNTDLGRRMRNFFINQVSCSVLPCYLLVCLYGPQTRVYLWNLQFISASYKAMFSGNVDDCFRLGIQIQPKFLKLYTDFYSSDIIIASPLGLRTVLDSARYVNMDGITFGCTYSVTVY